MKLERLQVFDIEQTVELAVEFNQHHNMIRDINKQKLRRLLEAALIYDRVYYAIVLKDEDKVVGALVAIAAEHPYSDTVLASELGWYVKEEYRGLQSIQMVKEFESWAKSEAKADFVSMVYTTRMSDLSKLYTRLGYSLAEHGYIKALK